MTSKPILVTYKSISKVLHALPVSKKSSENKHQTKYLFKPNIYEAKMFSKTKTCVQNEKFPTRPDIKITSLVQVSTVYFLSSTF